MKEYVYEEEDGKTETFNLGHLPKELKLVQVHRSYNIYRNEKTKKLCVDILGKKQAQPNSYFFEVANIQEAIELIELMANAVRN